MINGLNERHITRVPAVELEDLIKQLESKKCEKKPQRPELQAEEKPQYEPCPEAKLGGKDIKKSRRKDKWLLERQLDMFGMADPSEQPTVASPETRPEVDIEPDQYIFTGYEINKDKNVVVATFKENPAYFDGRSTEYQVDLPIVDKRNNTVALSNHAIVAQDAIEDDDWKAARNELSELFVQCAEAIEQDKGPVDVVILMRDFSIRHVFEDIAEDYDKKEFKFSEKVFHNHIFFMLGEDLVKPITKDYGNALTSGEKEEKRTNTAVGIPAVQELYNGFDEGATVILRPPQMIDNAYRAMLTANLIDVIEGRMEPHQLHEKVERPEIQKVEKLDLDKIRKEIESEMSP